MIDNCRNSSRTTTNLTKRDSLSNSVQRLAKKLCVITLHNRSVRHVFRTLRPVLWNCWPPARLRSNSIKKQYLHEEIHRPSSIIRNVCKAYMISQIRRPENRVSVGSFLWDAVNDTAVSLMTEIIILLSVATALITLEVAYKASYLRRIHYIVWTDTEKLIVPQRYNVRLIWAAWKTDLFGYSLVLFISPMKFVAHQWDRATSFMVEISTHVILTA